MRIESLPEEIHILTDELFSASVDLSLSKDVLFSVSGPPFCVP